MGLYVISLSTLWYLKFYLTWDRCVKKSIFSVMDNMWWIVVKTVNILVCYKNEHLRDVEVFGKRPTNQIDTWFYGRVRYILACDAVEFSRLVRTFGGICYRRTSFRVETLAVMLVPIYHTTECYIWVSYWGCDKNRNVWWAWIVGLNRKGRPELQHNLFCVLCARR
jgi:hypothetical protein